MNRGLKALVIATGVITALTVIGAPWLRITGADGHSADKKKAAHDLCVAQGREFFELYSQLEQRYDPAILDLYTETAVIIDRRPSSHGKSTDLKIPASVFKPMLRGWIPIAKARGEPLPIYGAMKYLPEDDGVRIESDCYSDEDEFERHMSILIRPNDAGVWLIHELVAESPNPRQ